MTQKTSVKKAICPDKTCNSSWTMWRQRTKDFLCRKCGNVFTLKPQTSVPPPREDR